MTDAAYGTDLDGVTLSLRHDMDTTNGAAIHTATSDSSGAFTIEVSTHGMYTLTATKDGYLDTYSNIALAADSTDTLLSMAPALEADQMLIAVQWGPQLDFMSYANHQGTPTDLDVYLKFAVSDQSECMVYHGRDTCGGASLLQSDSVAQVSGLCWG